MEFNDNSVVFFKPQNLPINLIIAKKNMPILAYYSIKEIPILKNFFKVILPNSSLIDYARKVEAYTLCNRSNEQTLLQFLLYAKNAGKDVIISIPIFKYQKEIINGAVASFGNFISCDTSAMTDEQKYALLETEIKETVINGEAIVTPCDICHLKNQKIGDICIYKTNSYDCLFNCNIQVTQEEPKQEKEFITNDLKSLAAFWETPTGKEYKE